MKQESYIDSDDFRVGSALNFKGNIRAVAVDDEAEVVTTIVELMQDFGVEVVGEIDPYKAFDLIKSYQPDVVILDIIMPGMDGYELATKMAEDENTREIPIVYLTAKDFKNDLCQSFARGGTMYLKKPFLAEELADSLRIAVSLSKAV